MAGSDESTNHGCFRRSDTLGRRGGSNTRICRSSVINPGVSSTFDFDRTLCSRGVLRVLATYDAPIGSIENQEPFTSKLTYPASVPTPQEVAQVRPSVHPALPFHRRQTSSSETLTWLTHKTFETLVLYRSVNLVGTYQASHRPNVHRWSKFDLEWRWEMAQDRLRSPNLEWRVEVLRCLGTEESCGMLMLGDTDETTGTNLRPSR